MGLIQPTYVNTEDMKAGKYLGLTPKPCTSLRVIPGDQKVTIYVTDASDTVIDSQKLVTVAGTKVVYKTGSAPAGPEDGTEVFTSTPGQYESEGYELTGLTNETTYYFAAYTISDHGMTCLDAHVISVAPTEQEVATISVAIADSLSELPDSAQTHIVVTDTTASTIQTGDILNGVGSKSFNIPIGHTYSVTINLRIPHYSIVDGQVVVTYEDVESVTTETNGYYISEGTKGPYTAERGNTRSISFTIQSLKIVTWAGGTDEQVARMVSAAQAGLINLSDYWSVGDERTVHLSAMAATGVGEAQAEQDVVMVLMHAGGVPLYEGGECNFVVGQKNALSTNGYMNSSNKNSGSWGSSARRTWCNDVYYNALPTYFKNMLLSMKTKTPNTETGSEWQEVEDKIALPSVAQVWAASGSYMNTNEFKGDLVQFDWYKTAANRIKKTGEAGAACYWWERSPSDYSSYRGQCFCLVNTDGSATYGTASNAYGVAPFGCI